MAILKYFQEGKTTLGIKGLKPKIIQNKDIHFQYLTELLEIAAVRPGGPRARVFRVPRLCVDAGGHVVHVFLAVSPTNLLQDLRRSSVMSFRWQEEPRMRSSVLFCHSLLFAVITIVPARAAEWPEARPEEMGVKAGVLNGALAELLGANKTGAAVLAVRGKLVWEHYWDGFGPNSRFDTYSAGKAYAAAAIGLLVDDGKLKIEGDSWGFGLKYNNADYTANTGERFDGSQLGLFITGAF